MEDALFSYHQQWNTSVVIYMCLEDHYWLLDIHVQKCKHGNSFAIYRKGLNIKMCVIILSNFCLKHFVLKMCTEMHVGLHVKWSLKLSNLNENWNGTHFFFCKILHCEISWRSVKEFSSCHSYRQTDFNRCSAEMQLPFKKSYCVVVTNQSEILFL